MFLPTRGMGRGRQPAMSSNQREREKERTKREKQKLVIGVLLIIQTVTVLPPPTGASRRPPVFSGCASWNACTMFLSRSVAHGIHERSSIPQPSQSTRYYKPCPRPLTPGSGRRAQRTGETGFHLRHVENIVNPHILGQLKADCYRVNQRVNLEWANKGRRQFLGFRSERNESG